MPAEIPDGAFIVARAIFNSSLWTMRKEDRLLAITLIGLANFKDRPWFDGHSAQIIRRGETVRSLKELAKAAQLSIQEVRTSLKRLEKVQFLTRKPTRQYTHIKLLKYDFYQTLDKYSDSVNTEPNTPLTRTQHAPNTRVTRGQHAPNNKQEGEEGKERQEGEEGEKGAPRAGEVSLQDVLDATAYFGSPGAKTREAALKDLHRQKISYERISSVAGEAESKQMDFYEFVKKCRNGTNGTSSGADEWLRKQKEADDE